MKRRLCYALASLLCFSNVGHGDRLDDLIDKVSIQEQKGEWRDHLALSFFQTISDTYFLSNFDKDAGRNLAKETRFLEVIAHQGLYTPTLEDKITPIYALSDVLGIEVADLLYERIEPHLKWFDSLNKKPDKKEIIDFGILALSSYIIGGRNPIYLDLHAKEKIDHTLWAHSLYFGYTTFRTSLQVDNLSKTEYPLEKVAWRSFKIGLLKELVFDAGWGTGPSILDLLADGAGVYIGYKSADYFLDKKFSISMSGNRMFNFSLYF
ncbi:MAG: hypothetical protein AABX49_00250 [Nanoarchaeota archaeon]